MNKKLSFILVLLMVFSIAFTGCSKEEKKGTESQKPTDEAVEINISAAASLTDALTELQTEYAKKSNANLMFNFGGSGALQQQIQEGAPCDLFFSASKDNMDNLEKAGLVLKETRKDLLGNTLTLIASKEKKEKIKDEKGLLNKEIKSISIGVPESVPAGKYAKESFKNLGNWDQIQSKLIFAKDVRQVLEYVDSGNVDCGIVYKSDALLLKTGSIVSDLPEDSHSKIVYPTAIMKEAKQPKAAKAFYQFLQSDEAKGVFEKYGFKVL